MADNAFLKIAKVGERYGISRSQVLRLVDKGVIPEPVKLSERCVRWPVADLDIWDQIHLRSNNINDREEHDQLHVCNPSPKTAPGAIPRSANNQSPLPNAVLSSPISAEFKWNEVYDLWKHHISIYLPDLVSVITPMPLHDPGKPRGRRSDYSFWPVKEVDTIYAQAQALLDRCPGSDGIVHPPMLKGCMVTADYLGVARKSLSASCALLMAASLRSRGKCYSIFNYRNPHKISQLKEVVGKEVRRSLGSRFDGWANACTTVLPHTLLDTQHNADILAEVIQLLAKEHAQLLRKYRVVGIDYLPRRSYKAIELIAAQEHADKAASAVRDEIQRRAEQRLRKTPRKSALRN